MKTLPPPTPAGRAMGNDCVADHLREVAELLDGQGANPFRVGAYRRAAETVRGLAGDVAALLEAEGPAGLRELPGIGETMARAIEQIVQSCIGKRSS